MSDLATTEARRELRDLAARVKELKATMAEAIYDLGVLLLDVRERALWQDAGYPSFFACVEDAFGLGRRTAYRAMEVATHFGPEIARRYGSEKLLAMHRYMKATAVVEEPGDLLAAVIQIRGDDGRWQSLPMHEASLRQIQQATGLVRRRQAAREDAAEARRAARAERLARLEAALPAAGAPAPVKVRARGDGRVTWRFPAISEDDMPAFIDALRAEFVRGGDGE